MAEKIIYEVLRVIDEKPLFLEDHLERMNNSFALINYKFRLTYDEVSEKINNLIKSKSIVNGNIKLTYEMSEKKLNIFQIEHSYPTKEMYENGVKVILHFGERENPNAKIINQDFRDKVNQEIKENNAYEAILIDRNGLITEGSRSNIFMVKGDVLLTAPVSSVLPGVTRGKIVECAQNLGIMLKEIEYRYSDINELDAMFISGTSPKILPINSVGNIKLDEKNSIVLKLINEYDKEIEKYLSEK